VACQRAVGLGAIVSVAAGNRGPGYETVRTPGDAPSVATIGAVDNAMRLAGFSSRGSPDCSSTVHNKPTAVATGFYVCAAPSQYSNLPPAEDSYYSVLSGTSIAAPTGAGALALLRPFARAHKQRDDPDAILYACQQGCRPLDSSNGRAYEHYEVGHGLIDVEASLRALIGGG
jgi:subtilisin family serine protease